MSGEGETPLLYLRIYYTKAVSCRIEQKQRINIIDYE